MRRAKCAVLVFAVGLTLPGRAIAADFDDEGTFSFDPEAVFTLDFEQAIAGSDLRATLDDGALVATKVLSLPVLEGVNIDVAVPEARQQYRVSAWVRGAEVAADFEVSYSDRIDEVTALYPTGRMTSDGWVELSNIARVEGDRLTRATVGFLATAKAEVDAIEIVPVGPLPTLMQNRACSGISDPVCGPGQLCEWSVCRNVEGRVPPIPADRERVTSFFESRIELMFGPLQNRASQLPAARVAMEQMRAADDPWTYWNGFLFAVRLLSDAHTSTSGLSDLVLDNPRPVDACFIEGSADLTHASVPAHPTRLDLLVSHAGGGDDLGLRQGDRLVSVDGKHPIEWAASLLPYHWRTPLTSNRQTSAELAASLRSLISRYATTIEIIRCSETNGVGTCAEPTTVSISALPLVEAGRDRDRVSVSCDNRPLRHLEGVPESHADESGFDVHAGILNESDSVEAIYGLEWDSMFVSGGVGVGDDLSAAVNVFKQQASGVILDHRNGRGGTFGGPEIFWDWLSPTHPSFVYFDRQRAEDELLTVDQGALLFQDLLDLGAVEYVGSASPQIDLPVALMLTRDVSASDWLPLGLLPAEGVRSFGPYATNGAFSTLYHFGYWLSMSFSMAAGDTYVPSGLSQNGTGIAPDVVVIPLQSDLVVGRDTVFEAALAWVRQEAAL